MHEVLTLLGISVVAVAVFSRFHLPPIVGYLFVGFITGPHALSLVHPGEVTHLLGEIGVAFLLFTIGLEFSVSQLKAMKTTLLGLGGTQVAVGTVSGALISWGLGIDWAGAFIVGGALSLSSTAIVVRQLADQLELQSRHGRLSLGVLLFQDLAAVPFLVIIPILAAQTGQSLVWPLILALIKGAVAFLIMLMLGRWALRPLFHMVTASRAPDLLTLTILLVSLAAAWITSLLGLSLALGAFLAGIMLGETEYRHQIETDIRPFRDVLLSLFFVTVGMQLDSAQLLPVWPWIALILTGVVIGKGGAVALLTRAAGYDRSTALRTGLVLGQGGEFGIALLTLAIGTGLIAAEQIQSILTATILSMAIAPLLIRHNGEIAARVFRRHPPHEHTRRERQIAEAVRAIDGHVIICGFGRTGRTLANLLKEEGFEYVGLDLDPEQIRHAWEAGERVFYGDATHGGILEAAGLSRARALVITFDDVRGALKILYRVRAERGELPVLVRARDDATLEQLLDAGATEGVPETLEASLMLAFQLLLLLEVSVGAVTRRMQAVRSTRYQLLRDVFQEPDIAVSGEDRHLRTLRLAVGSPAVGERLCDLDLGAGVVVTMVQRHGRPVPARDPELILEADDVLVLHGTPDQLERVRGWLLKGGTEEPGKKTQG